MYAIEIPDSSLDFVSQLLCKLIDLFDDYIFINCTESPLKELSYLTVNSIYYRLVDNKCIKELIDEKNYIESYKLDKIDQQGYTLNQYIEMCILYELENIIVVSKNMYQKFDESIIELQPDITISICPDGLNEIQITGNLSLIDKIIKC